MEPVASTMEKIEPTQAAKVKVVYEGETVDAEEMEFRPVSGELVVVFELGDGARIEIKQVIMSAYRLCDKKREDGSPIYLLTGHAAVRQLPQEEAKS